MSTSHPILFHFFDVITHASLLGLACLWIGWMRGRFDATGESKRILIWGLCFALLATVTMLAPTEPMPGMRIDVRNGMVALAAVFGGLRASTIVGVFELALRYWLGGSNAPVGMIGIALSLIPAGGFAFYAEQKRRAGKTGDPTLGALAVLGLLAGISGPAASFVTADFTTAIGMIAAGGAPQTFAVLLSVLVFATIVIRADRAHRDRIALQEREAHLMEANAQLSELTVRLERRNQDYARASKQAETLAVQMNAIFSHAPFGVFIKEIDGRFRLLNEAAAKQLGQTVEALIGRQPADFLSPAEAERSRAADAEVVATGLPSIAEYHAMTPDAPEWMWSIKFPIMNLAGKVVAIGGFSLDVTKVKQHEIMLERTAQQLRRVHQITKIIYWYHKIGADGRRTRVGGHPDDFLALTGWPASEALDMGNYLAKCVHPDHRARMRGIYAAFARGETDQYICEYDLIRADGAVMPVKVWAERVREPENGDEFIRGAMQDVSEQHEREQRLAEAMAQAEMSDRVKTEFLANLSHELRTPLNAVIGFSSLLRRQLEQAGATTALEYAGYIDDSGQRLAAIVSDLLEIARLDFGSRELTETTFEAAGTVAGCVALIEERFASKRPEIAAIPARPGIVVRAERGYFIQALMNVLTNAAQYSSVGGEIRVDLGLSAAGELELAVSDRGPGIAEELLPELAVPFARGESAYTRRNVGVGLGLAMCRRILELHGGSMRIESKPGEGTRVTLIFPASRVIRGVVEVSGAGR